MGQHAALVFDLRMHDGDAARKCGVRSRVGKLHIRFVITTKNAQPYRYSGASSAWRRAVDRACHVNCHFHDIRAKALTDKEEKDGMQGPRLMAGHSTEQQTADYIASKATAQISATR